MQCWQKWKQAANYAVKRRSENSSFKTPLLLLRTISTRISKHPHAPTYLCLTQSTNISKRLNLLDIVLCVKHWQMRKFVSSRHDLMSLFLLRGGSFGLARRLNASSGTLFRIKQATLGYLSWRRYEMETFPRPTCSHRTPLIQMKDTLLRKQTSK